MTPRPSPRRSFAGALLLALATGPAGAEPPIQGPVLGPPRPEAPAPFVRGFEPEGKYELFVGEEEATDARIAIAQKEGNLLLLQAEELGGGVVLRPKDKGVVPLGEGAIMEELDGSYAAQLAEDATPVSSFQIDKDGIHFVLGGRQFHMKGARVKLGPHEGEELLAADAGYEFRSRQYVPDLAALEALKGAAPGVRVRVFFGSWCSACARKLPRLLRVQRDLGGEGLEFEYVGLPRKFVDTPEAKEFSVTGVPTGVILAGDEEIGRLRGNDWLQPEVTLRERLEEKGRLAG